MPDEFVTSEEMYMRLTQELAVSTGMLNGIADYREREGMDVEWMRSQTARNNEALTDAHRERYRGIIG